MVKSTSNGMTDIRPPVYPLPVSTAFRLLLAGILVQKRSFHLDSLKMVEPVRIKILGCQWIPSHGNLLLTINHYHRQGFGIWWAIAALSAQIEPEICWIMTSNWTYPGQRRDRVIRPFSRFLFARIAQTYSFITMPPMPPAPDQVKERSIAVRNVLKYVQQTRNPIVGLSPEGMDIPTGYLGFPPPGSGRFINHLIKQNLEIVPIGIYEENSRLCLNFGPHYQPVVDENISSSELDHEISQIVMTHIADLLPTHLRGSF